MKLIWNNGMKKIGWLTTNILFVIDKHWTSSSGFIFENKIAISDQLNQPFLILELTRIVPYIVRGKIRFHLFNLPNYKIGKVEIMGVIRHIDDNQDKYYKIQGNGLGCRLELLLSGLFHSWRWDGANRRIPEKTSL